MGSQRVGLDWVTFTTMRSSNSTPSYIPKGIKSRSSNRYASVHSSTIPKSQKVETTQMSVDRQKNKENVAYTTMNYYSDTKRNEALIKTTVWMSLEHLMLRERRQSLQDKWNVRFIEIKVDERLLRVGEKGMEITDQWDLVSISGDENVLEIKSGNDCLTVWM